MNALVWKHGNLFAYRISMRYGNHRHVVLHLLAKFHSNRTKLWRHIDFSFRRVRDLLLGSGLVTACTPLKKWKSICLPNFNEIPDNCTWVNMETASRIPIWRPSVSETGSSVISVMDCDIWLKLNRYTRKPNINFLCQGFKRCCITDRQCYIQTDRHTDATKTFSRRF